MTRIVILLSVLVISVGTVNANPVFARQYSAPCAMCHTVPPALNEPGLVFLRQGFRLAKEESTAVDAISQSKQNKLSCGFNVGYNV